MDVHNELNFVEKLRQPTVSARIEELVANGSTRGPLVVEFDPTTACNFKCPECISLGLLNRGQIASGRVIELINEFHEAGVKGIIFIGGGEPLAHSSMPMPIQQAYDLGMAVGLTTNGSLVGRHIETIATCVSWTRFSVDAATEETFNFFRPSNIKDSFRRVISNIDLLARRRKGKVGYSFLLMERQVGSSVFSNVDEITSAAKLAKELGCDYFEFKPAVDEDHHLIPLSSKTKEILFEELIKLREITTDDFRVIYPMSIDHLLNFKVPNQPKSYTICPTLELRTVVTPSGIYPCPYKRGNSNVRMAGADVRFDTFWASEQRVESARRVNPSTDCPFFCIRHEMNEFLNHLLNAFFEGENPIKPFIPILSTEEDIFI